MSIAIGGVTSQIMDLKTGTPGVTRKEEIKTGFGSVDDYARYLQGKYDYMNIGKTSMQGVPVTVNMSPAFLAKCKDNPEKAAYLEENLSAIPDCVKMAVDYTKCMPGGAVMTYLEYTFDANGNLTIIGGSTNDPDGKIARENAERKAAEEKAAQKKSEKKRAEEKAENKREAERKDEHKELLERAAEESDTSAIELTAYGDDVRALTGRIIDGMSGGLFSEAGNGGAGGSASGAIVAGLDIRG